jgi:hypothetical protein
MVRVDLKLFGDIQALAKAAGYFGLEISTTYHPDRRAGWGVLVRSLRRGLEMVDRGSKGRPFDTFQNGTEGRRKVEEIIQLAGLGLGLVMRRGPKVERLTEGRTNRAATGVEPLAPSTGRLLLSAACRGVMQDALRAEAIPNGEGGAKSCRCQANKRPRTRSGPGFLVARYVRRELNPRHRGFVKSASCLASVARALFRSSGSSIFSLTHPKGRFTMLSQDDRIKLKAHISPIGR